MSDIFTGRLRSEIPSALTHILTACLHEKPHLKELNLSDNAFGPAGADPLAPFLEACQTLEYLHLNNNGLGVTGGTTIAKALIKRSETHTPTLKVLVAGRNRLENGSSALLAQAFKLHAQTIKVVRLPQNGIRPEGIVNLVQDGLGYCSKLKWLDFQDNTLTLSGSESIAHAMNKKAWPNMQALNLADALIGSKGGIAICKSLIDAPLSDLLILNLSYGEIDERAIRHLAVAVNHMPALISLEINGNRFQEDSEAVEQLLSVLKRQGKAEGVLGDLDDMEDISDESDADLDEDKVEDQVESRLSELNEALEKAEI